MDENPMRLKQNYQGGAVERVQPRVHHPNLETNPSHHRNLDSLRQPCPLRTYWGSLHFWVTAVEKSARNLTALDPARPGPSQVRCRALTLTWKVDEVPPATLGDDHTRWSLCELRE